MKTLHETFEDSEFEALLLIKGKKTWHEFIMELIPEEKEVKEISQPESIKDLFEVNPLGNLNG